MSGKTFSTSLFSFVLLLMFAGCEKQGPLERAGETTGNKIDDAIDEVADAAADVREDLE